MQKIAVKKVGIVYRTYSVEFYACTIEVFAVGFVVDAVTCKVGRMHVLSNVIANIVITVHACTHHQLEVGILKEINRITVHLAVAEKGSLVYTGPCGTLGDVETGLVHILVFFCSSLADASQSQPPSAPSIIVYPAEVNA